MSFERIKKYFDGVGLGQRVVEREQIGATVDRRRCRLAASRHGLQKQCRFFSMKKLLCL